MVKYQVRQVFYPFGSITERGLYLYVDLSVSAHRLVQTVPPPSSTHDTRYLLAASTPCVQYRQLVQYTVQHAAALEGGGLYMEDCVCYCHVVNSGLRVLSCKVFSSSKHTRSL